MAFSKEICFFYPCPSLAVYAHIQTHAQSVGIGTSTGVRTHVLLLWVCVSIWQMCCNVCVSCIHTAYVDVEVYKCLRYFSCTVIGISQRPCVCFMCEFMCVYKCALLFQSATMSSASPSLMLNLTRHVSMFPIEINRKDLSPLIIYSCCVTNFSLSNNN